MSEQQGRSLSLLDIGPNSESVQISKKGGKPVFVEVFGVSAKGVFEVFKRYPEIMKWFKGGGKIDLTQLIDQTPDAIAAVIAAGCGEPGNEKAEATAAKLTMEAQLEVLEAIGRQTFALKGFGPFVERMAALAETAAVHNYGRAVAMKSPQVSKPSLPPDMTQKKSGT